MIICIYIYFIPQKYNKDAKLEEIKGQVLVANISSVIKSMMDKKQQALKASKTTLYT